jgi:hypothetical protein
VPRAPERRRILCTSCDLPSEIAAEAKSVNCPHCHSRIVTEALDVDGYVAVRKFGTANRLHVKRKGRVYAALRAESLELDGFLQGEAVALHGIRVGAKAVIAGNLRSSSLSLEYGATLVGHVAVGPDLVPELQNLWTEAATEILPDGTTDPRPWPLPIEGRRDPDA